MGKILIIVVIVLIVGAGAFYVLNMNQQKLGVTATNSVEIKNFAFSPATITVKAGDTVTWTNNDSMAHSATSDDGSFDTGIMEDGHTKSITFNKAGSFVYHCSVHPNMKGTVIVQ